MLALLCIYLSWYIFVGVGEIAIIQCYLILSTTEFQFITITKKYCRH